MPLPRTSCDNELQREILLAVEDRQRILDRVISQRDGADGLCQAHCLIERTLMDVATRSVAACAADVDLVIQLREEGLRIDRGTTRPRFS